MRAAALLLLPLVGAVCHADPLERVTGNRLCVTRGRVEALAEGRVRIREPKVRAVVAGSDGQRVEMKFTYQGPSEDSSPLDSGELRRQVGLKLHAHDSCNLLYVMWRIAPKAQVVVSVKRNPGQKTHAECGTHGYTNLKGTGVQPPPLEPGSTHVLAATLNGRALEVFADGKLAWKGDVGEEAASLTGPVGVRTDNARVELELRAPLGKVIGDCSAGGED